MKIRLLSVLLTLAFTTNLSFAQTWTGTVSTSWNTGGNWSTGTVPAINGNVIINNATAPNQPQLISDVSIRDLRFSAGFLDLNGFTLTTNDDLLLRGGTVSNGSFIGFDIQRIENTTFNGSISITDTGNSDTWQGGNTFNGPTTIINNGNNYIRMANSNGDTYNSTVTFENNGTNFLDIARRGTNAFSQSITINNSNAAGEIRFGENGGTSTLTTGALVTTGFTTGNLLELNNFTQVQNVANGSFTVTDFRAVNSTFEGNFNVTANDDLLFQGGANFAGSNTFIAADAITMTGGNSFSTNPGTSTSITKNGSSNNNWQGGNTFGDFTFITTGSGRTRMANSAGGDTFLGDFTVLENGTGEIEPARNGTNTFAGDISTIGSGNALSFALGNGVVSIIGNTAQAIRGDGATTLLFEDLTMNTTGDLTLEVPITIRDQNGGTELNLNSGIINTTATNIITMLDEADASAGSSSSHVDGPLIKLGEDTFVYPIGDAGFYAPLTLNNGGGNSDSYSAEYLYIAPVDIPTDTASRDATIGLMNRNEHWELLRNAGSANRNITLSYDASRTQPLVDYTELLSIHWDGSSWIELGGGPTGDNTSGTITAGNTSNLGYFTIGNSFRILPIELLSFKGRVLNDEKVLIEWRTASERNNAFFTLERSLDGENWETIAIVEGAGDSDAQLEYSHTDTNPRIGRQFYRLTQTDFDGNFEVFQVIGVSLDQDNTEHIDFDLYPNPTSNVVKIRSQNINLNEVQLSILDAQGREVIRLDQMSNTRQEIELGNLQKGLYLFKFISLRGLVIKKLILQ